MKGGWIEGLELKDSRIEDNNWKISVLADWRKKINT
jgi:hypothetical protein